jgi:hypothetical protein
MGKRKEEGDNVFDGVDGVALGGALVAGGVDLANDFWPHCFDRISPEIENHIGNVPVSMLGVCSTMFVWKMFFRPRLIRSKSGPLTEVADAAMPIVAVAVMTGVNILFEALKPNNYEMMGDIKAGILGAAMVGMVYLVQGGVRFLVKWNNGAGVNGRGI